METRLLLWIWFAAQSGKTVTQSQAVSKLKRKSEAAAGYRQALQVLKSAGAIAIENNRCSMTPSGEKRLAEGLAEPSFVMSGNIVGAWVANGLLAWFRQAGTPAVAPLSNGAAAKTGAAKTKAALTSYEAFQKVALETYDQLNRDYNLDDLVPIYRIRREIGEQVSRSDFDQWLLEMQSEDVVQLIGGEMPELTPDKAEDSIQTRMGTTRYYAKRLAS